MDKRIPGTPAGAPESQKMERITYEPHHHRRHLRRPGQAGGKTVTVCGWARTIRDMKTFGFIELNDGSCFKNLQVVMDANMLDNYKDIAGQNVGPPSSSPAPWS